MSQSASKKQWYLHLQGETMGPLLTSVVLSMLKQKRLDYIEFVWSEGMPRWLRVCEVTEFSSELPAYPAGALPSGENSESLAASVSVSETVPEKAKPAAPPRVPTVDEAPPAPAHPKNPHIKRAPPPEVGGLPSVSGDPNSRVHTRRYTRVPIEGAAEVAGEGRFSLVNISESGLFAESSAPMNIGSEITFKIVALVFEKPLDMTGIVIRSGVVQGKNGFAVEFTRINPACLRMIAKFITDMETSD